MDQKLAAAQGALAFIKNKNTIGLGAGATIAHLVTLLESEVKDGLEIKVLTSSFTTRQLLLKKGFTVQSIADVAGIDAYFDGCDQLDGNLNALKSGGGIHTREKLFAVMATGFFLLADQSKYVERFDPRYPLVLEILPESLNYLPLRINAVFPGIKTTLRTNDKRDGAVITENGNYLLDAWFKNLAGPRAGRQPCGPDHWYCRNLLILRSCT
jgi:ribose 5-phosphate isomerase A